MIIANLSHMETIAQDHAIHGGGYEKKYCEAYKPVKPETVEKPYKPGIAIALANAEAKASGLKFAFTDTDTFTEAKSGPHGVSAVSTSSSKAIAS
ncbi:hypothetical protein V0288_20505 [Pannus brasiliensis CCIBt3594]|uniref:Uncharacterized protein n=1 Tax=Pannus brasiliensis CCIBt3594 TaxID=1427578 RepID=A0AAW9R066_9CHRO